VGQLDLVAQLALELLHPRPQPAQLVLEPQHVLDAARLRPELVVSRWMSRRRSTSASEVETRAARRSRGTGRGACLVHPQRLRVQPREVGRDGDHVPPALGHGYELLHEWSRGCSRGPRP
jgi:hypothetical protein